MREGTPVATMTRDPLLRRVGIALALYRLAEFGPWVAMLVYAYAQGGAAETGIVSLALLVPTALFAPLTGPLIDRHGASRVLLAAYVAQAATAGATAAALHWEAPSIVVYVFGALTAMALVVTHPAHAVVSPAIARTTDQLVALNAITGWILSIGLVAAPALAGVVLAVGSPAGVYAAGAACVVVAAILVYPLRALVPPLAGARERSALAEVLADVRSGSRALVEVEATGEVTLVLVATFVMVGAFDVLAVVLAISELGLGSSGAGYLTALHGLGAVVGAALSLTLVGRSRIVPVLVAAALAGGIAFVLLGLWTTLAVALVTIAVTGLSRSLFEVSAQTLLQRVTPTAMLARVFALKEGLAMGAWALGSVLVPVLVAIGGVTAALIGTGAIVPVVVALRLRRLWAIDAAATVPVVAIALLRSLRIFRGLPVPALEGVAHNASSLSVPQGTAIVVQGDSGNCYYAIADGEVEVTRDGRHVARIGRGEGFGEIALLHGTVRTATVTAVADTTLLEVDREAFLVALTGHDGTAAEAGSIADERLASYRT